MLSRRGRKSARGAKGKPRNRRIKPNRKVAKKQAAAAKAPAASKTKVKGRPVLARLRWSSVARVARYAAILTLVAVVVTGAVLAYRYVVRSPHFHVKQVKVSPTVHVSADQIRRLAGIGERTNIFTVKLDRVAARVRRHPWIATAKAVRRMPDAIEISVTEHEARAAVLMETGRPGESHFYLVDPEGLVFKRAVSAELEGLPLITGVSRADYRGQRPEATARIRLGIALAKRYAVSPGRPRLGEIHVDQVEGLTVYTAARAVQVRFGRGGLASKLRRFDRLWALLAKRGQRPEVIRLDNARQPKRVTVRLAQAPAVVSGVGLN